MDLSHSRRRARQRVGIKLTRNNRAQILAEIRNGHAELVGINDGGFDPKEKGRETYQMSLCGRWMHVIYCPKVKNIITFLRKREIVG